MKSSACPVRRLLLLLLASLVSPAWPPAAAQEFRGTILGRITDPQRAPVPGATVSAVNEKTGIAYPAEERQKPPCCFNHPRYAGSCVVDLSSDETCGTILAYLNNPKGAGKSYCNNAALRGGWKAVRCKPARGSPSSRTSSAVP